MRSWYYGLSINKIPFIIIIITTIKAIAVPSPSIRM